MSMVAALWEQDGEFWEAADAVVIRLPVAPRLAPEDEFRVGMAAAQFDDAQSEWDREASRRRHPAAHAV